MRVFLRRVFSSGLIVLITLLSGRNAEGHVVPAAGRVDENRLNAADREPEQWLSTGRDAGGSFYSPLDSINSGTVKDLGLAWEYRLGTRRGLEATPLVVDGVMYAVGNWSIVYALDASSGKLLWTYDPQSNPQRARFESNDVVSRGITVWKGKVLVLSPDCRLIALNAANGAVKWQVSTLEDARLPYSCNSAPQMAGDLAIVGNAGGDSSHGGLRGYVSAYDTNTGEFRWRFHTVPSLKDENPSSEMLAAAKTWDPKRDPAEGGGGNVWHGTAYDARLGLVYIGTGNAAPYGVGGGDRLYTAAIVALRAATGRMAWYYQTTPGDQWDFDAAESMVLADMPVNGHERAVLLQANKNGYFYVLDRATGKPVSVKPFAYMNWSTGMDAQWRPIVAKEADYHATPKLIYPSSSGAHSWAPMAWSPKTKLAYIPSLDVPNFIVDLTTNPGASLKFVDLASDGIGIVFPDKDYDPSYYKPIYGTLPTEPGANRRTGKPLLRASIKAFDPLTGQTKWEQQTSQDYLLLDGGTLATAGDIVFAGRESGQFVAYDARSGNILKTLEIGTPIMAAPMTYAVNGTQYVAVMGAHGGSVIASFVGTAAMKYVNEGRILVFKLGGSREVPKPQLRDDPSPISKPPERVGSDSDVAQGFRLFSTYCARCHAMGVPGITPDLSRLADGIENSEVFKAIVLKGAFVSRGMARFDDVLTSTDADLIHAYLIDAAWKAFKPEAPKSPPSH